MIKKLASLFSLAMFLLAVSFATLAGQPTFDVIEDAYDYMFESCDGFDIWTSGVWSARLTDFYNDDGDVIRRHVKGEELDVVFYNKDHPEIAVESSASDKSAKWSTWVYPQAVNPDLEWCYDDPCPAFHESGVFWRFKLAGYGWLSFNVGFHNWDPFVEDGWTQHGVSFDDPDMVDILCEKLAP